jgi:hypothetical protein
LFIYCRREISMKNVVGTLLVCLLLAMAASCGRKAEPNGGTAMQQRDINLVKDSLAKELMSIPGVVGVYVGQTNEGAPCIGVMVAKRTPELEQQLPRSVEGYPVLIDETGEIKPMDSTRRG